MIFFVLIAQIIGFIFFIPFIMLLLYLIFRFGYYFMNSFIYLTDKFIEFYKFIDNDLNNFIEENSTKNDKKFFIVFLRLKIENKKHIISLKISNKLLIKDLFTGLIENKIIDNRYNYLVLLKQKKILYDNDKSPVSNYFDYSIENNIVIKNFDFLIK